jgi:DNA-binding NarL/FixJ family response regulator
MNSKRVTNPRSLILIHLGAGTGHDEPGAAERVRAPGASAYLRKPVTEAVLLSAIKSTLPRTTPRLSQPPGPSPEIFAFATKQLQKTRNQTKNKERMEQ